MINMFKILVVVMTIVFPIGLHAGAPDYVIEGFKAYEKDGPKAAIERWVKGSVLEGNREALSQANMFRQIEDFYGPFENYELIKSVPIGSRSSVYLIIINFKSGPLYARFFAYKKSNGDIVNQSFNFHTEVDNVWPAYLIYEY